MLVVLGLGVIGTTVLASAAAAGGHSLPLKLLGLALSTVFNVALFLIAFRVLTVRRVTWADILPGAVVAAVAWEVLQAVGGYYLAHQVKSASDTYGFFAVVIGLLTWIYLQAQVTLLAAEINVVRVRRLWPRSLVADDLTHPDARALTASAKVEERLPGEDVTVRLADGDEAAQER
jgi:YihY family inner membrane protein